MSFRDPLLSGTSLIGSDPIGSDLASLIGLRVSMTELPSEAGTIIASSLSSGPCKHFINNAINNAHLSVLLGLMEKHGKAFLSLLLPFINRIIAGDAGALLKT